MTQPPEVHLDARTDTQRLEDAIVKACRTIRDGWPRMIAPGETQAPGRVNPVQSIPGASAPTGSLPGRGPAG